MCGIIGIRCKDTELGGYIFEELLLQSQIRGKHATGMSYFENGVIKTEIRPIKSSSFVELVEMPDSEFIIGHVRYSTSDLNYNQPLNNNKISIVHNGVMTQENPDDWEKHFGYDNFKTKNDSELLLKCLSSENIFNKKLLFNKFPNSSIACGMLENNKMCCFRNNTRPLWIFESVIENDNGNPFFSGFASTSDIIKRTFEKIDIETKWYEIKPFHKYIFMNDGKINKTLMISSLPPDTLFKEDQQKSTKIERKYV